MSKAYMTDTFRSIRRSMSRFLSMMLIVSLGSAVFCGFNAVYPDMIQSADRYYKQNNLLDIRIQSFIGLYEQDLEALREVEGIKSVAGARFVDGYVQMLNNDAEPTYEGLVDIDGSELTLRAYGYNSDDAKSYTNGKEDSDYINRLTLVEGEYADEIGECVVTNSGLTTPEGFIIGEKVKLVGDNESVDYYLKTDEFTIVGIVQTPYYVSFERGTTLAGSGKLGDYIYIPNETFTDSINYYSEAYITLDESDRYEAYTDEYDEYVNGYVDKIIELSGGLVATRATALKKEITPKVLSGEAELAAAESDVEAQLEDGRAQIEELKHLAENGDQLIADAQAELQSKYADALAQLEAGGTEYNLAVEQYNDSAYRAAEGRVQWELASDAYDDNYELYEAAEKELSAAELKIQLAKTEIAAANQLITSTETALFTLKQNQSVSAGDLDLDQMADRLEETNPELAKTLRSIGNLTAQGVAIDAIIETEKVLDEYKTQLAAAEQSLAESQALFNAKSAEYREAGIKLAAAKAELNEKDDILKAAERELSKVQGEIEDAGFTLQFGSIEARTEYMSAQAEIALKQAQLTQAEEYLETAEQTLAEKEAEADAKLSLARTTVSKGRALLDILDEASWNVYTRHDSPGYTGYGSAAYNMKMLSLIFPMMFFLVAVLVCLTVMTRMVEEERTQLGTLKALGYTNEVIVVKYVVYSALASFAGFVVGALIGPWGLPAGIIAAWGIMYEIPDRILNYIPSYILFSFVISVVSTVGASLLACRKELKTVTALLMRPKAPKAGKRVALEKVKFVWNKLSFTSKVTVRNLFRNKRRFITTIVGIMGCTGLLVTGVGVYYSTNTIINGQYYSEDCIANYDLQVVLKEAQESSQGNSVIQKIMSQPDIDSSMLTYLKVCKGGAEGWDGESEVNVLVPEDVTLMSDFVRVRDVKRGSAINIPNDGVVITDQFSQNSGAKIGDTITISWVEGAQTVKYEARVAGIAENYVFHYIYMSPEYYAELTGERPEFNYLVAKLKEDVTKEGRAQLETALNEMHEVNGSVYTSVIVGTFSNIITSLNLVICIVIGAAALLAFVVLNTLNNININERVREIATLKVLGFYDGEVSAYMYRENVILTIIGIITGLIFGGILERAVVSVISLDVVSFTSKPFTMMFVFAAALTILYTIIVNLMMHKKLKKISMVESLKSVE